MAHENDDVERQMGAEADLATMAGSQLNRVALASLVCGDSGAVK
ncbi:MAG: hypothetical protein WA191_27215 [Telluria sp.]